MKDQASASRQVDRIELFDTFVRIVEAGSLSAAASRMGSTQPTISRRLSALEHQLGLKLLQRSTHAMKLTEDGERCLVLARGLLETWQAMDEGLRGQAAQPQGTLRVLAPHAFGQQQLIGPVADYLQRYPGVSLEWLLNDRLPDFIAEGVDCAIRVGSVEDPSLVALKLGQVRRVVVSAPRWLEAANPPCHPRDLAALPWMAVRTFYQDQVLLNQEATGESFSFAIRPRFSTDSLYALRHAALRGLGLGIFSRWLVEDDLAAGRLVHLLPGWEAPPLPVYLVYPYSRLLPARLSRFIELIRQAAPLAIDL
ncbi:MAG: LysR family transcriptional regulator [Curvibacter sp.]|nr:MAG: LysR family transcriptional regulator [Curvibacter sp.]